MSTLRTNTLSNAAGSASVPVDTVISGSAKAWVNFNGTGTVAIRAAFNVSSITDGGVGLYTVNFTTALADANYCFVGSVARDTVTGISTINDQTGGTKTTSAFQITTQRSGSVSDYDFVWASFFR
jgi:hypothetical protein